MLIRVALLIATCFAGGVAFALAYIALVTLIGVFSRLASLSKTANMSKVYENMIFLGVLLGILLSVFRVHPPGGLYGLIIFTFVGGVFTGCIAGALEEVVKTFPVLSRRTKITQGMPYILSFVALGKGAGLLLWYVYLRMP